MTARILLVEDDPVCQGLAKGILVGAGFETDIAPDGFAALRLLRQRPYEIVMIDYHLPEMDGYTLAKLLREVTVKGESTFKLIGITADRNGLAARGEAKALFECILPKPYEPRHLIDSVRRLLPENERRVRDVRDAANALLAEPGFDHARTAARAFWRARGLEEVPKVFAVPKPNMDQAFNLGICFDLVGQDAADLLILLDVSGLEMLSRLREEAGSRLPPLLTLDKSLTLISDIYFQVSDPDSWSDVAECLHSFKRGMTLRAESRIVSNVADRQVHHDLQVFRKMTALIGNERSDALLARFSQILEGSFAAGDDAQADRQSLLEQAKATGSAAAMLGFSRLNETCNELEMAIQEDGNLEKALDKVRAAKLRSLRTLAQLRVTVGQFGAAS